MKKFLSGGQAAWESNPARRFWRPAPSPERGLEASVEPFTTSEGETWSERWRKVRGSNPRWAIRDRRVRSECLATRPPSGAEGERFELSLGLARPRRSRPTPFHSVTPPGFTIQLLCARVPFAVPREALRDASLFVSVSASLSVRGAGSGERGERAVVFARLTLDCHTQPTNSTSSGTRGRPRRTFERHRAGRERSSLRRQTSATPRSVKVNFAIRRSRSATSRRS